MATAYAIKDFTLTCNAPVIETPYEKTVSEYLLEKCRQHVENGKTTWTIDSVTGESFAFAQFDELSRNVASAFYKRGMRKGDIVIYMCYDIVKLHIFFNGAWRANGIPRALYPEELEESILRTVTESEAKWIYCSPGEAPSCLAVAKKVNWPLEVIVTEREVIEGCTSIYDLFQDDGSECPKLEASKDDPAIMMCTSGTTGPSKGAVHTHASVIKCWQRTELVYPFAEKNLILSKAPHISGSLMCLYSLTQGKTLITVSNLTMDNVIHAFDKYKPGFIFGFPTLLTSLAYDSRTKDMDKSCVEYLLSGGTNLKPTFASDLKEGFANFKFLINMYGLTEALPLVSTTYKPDSQSPHRLHEGLPLGSIGKVVGDASLQIRDETGEKCLGPNEEGEFCIKSLMRFSCYYKKEEETKKAFTSDGWFRTGDVGYYDENGFLFFSGRHKEMFKCSGNHVYPAQIDEVISKHPSVADVCTIGIDDPAGEKMPRAFVILKPGATTTADEIKKYAHTLLPTYKYLRGGVYCVDSLPKGTTGKITRLLVSKMTIPE